MLDAEKWKWKLVSRNEVDADVEDGLWAMLSIVVVAKLFFLRIDGQAIPSILNWKTAAYPSCADNSSTISQEMLIP